MAGRRPAASAPHPHREGLALVGRPQDGGPSDCFAPRDAAATGEQAGQGERGQAGEMP